MTIKQLNKIRDKISLFQICKSSGLDYSRINNKSKNEKELSVIESHLLEITFRKMFNTIFKGLE